MVRHVLFWQPAAVAPPVCRIEWPTGDHVDVTFGVERGPARGGHHVRFRLVGRSDPLEFPAMYVRELFAAGRHLRWLAVSPGDQSPIVDLRDVV